MDVLLFWSKNIEAYSNNGISVKIENTRITKDIIYNYNWLGRDMDVDWCCSAGETGRRREVGLLRL